MADWLEAAQLQCTLRPWMEPGDDILGTLRLHTFSVEAKYQRKLDLGRRLDQAAGQCPGQAIAVLVVHRLGHALVDEVYVVLSGTAFRDILGRLR